MCLVAIHDLSCFTWGGAEGGSDRTIAYSKKHGSCSLLLYRYAHVASSTLNRASSFLILVFKADRQRQPGCKKIQQHEIRVSLRVGCRAMLSLNCTKFICGHATAINRLADPTNPPPANRNYLPSSSPPFLLSPPPTLHSLSQFDIIVSCSSRFSKLVDFRLMAQRQLR